MEKQDQEHADITVYGIFYENREGSFLVRPCRDEQKNKIYGKADKCGVRRVRRQGVYRINAEQYEFVFIFDLMG